MHEHKRNILITGGAGYIGSHISHVLAQQGCNVLVLDTAVRAPNQLPWATCIAGNYGDRALLQQIFSTQLIDTVVHCAAFIEVGQSVSDPLAYYHNNVSNTITLLERMHEHGVHHMVFSSSCAVYGVPQRLPLAEDHPHAPISPYGHTKSMIEQVLRDVERAYGIRSVSLRFFNAAGAHPQAGLGEQHEPETHVIPLLLRAARNNRPFAIFGTTHPTPDGTCVRDFIHVRDLAHAHQAAIAFLDAGNASTCFNLGTGRGYSVREVIAMVEHVTHKTIHVIEKAARQGDPAVLVADATKAREQLGFQPVYSDLERIVRDAYIFEQERGQHAAARQGEVAKFF